MSDTTSEKVTVGLDLGDRFIHVDRAPVRLRQCLSPGPGLGEARQRQIGLHRHDRQGHLAYAVHLVLLDLEGNGLYGFDISVALAKTPDSDSPCSLVACAPAYVCWDGT
jgi:hypothetical protein